MEDLKAGVELDLLIAEKVMGISVHVGENWFHDGSPLYFVEPYSTDITSAWEVVEKLKEIPGKPEEWGSDFSKPFPISLCFNDGDWSVSWAPSSAYWIREYDSTSKSLPHAICLAALKAVGFNPDTKSFAENLNDLPEQYKSSVSETLYDMRSDVVDSIERYTSRLKK